MWEFGMMRRPSSIAIAMILSLGSVLRAAPEHRRTAAGGRPPRVADRLVRRVADLRRGGEGRDAAPATGATRCTRSSAGCAARCRRGRSPSSRRRLPPISRLPSHSAIRKLRLRGLTVKGDIDLEWDVDAAQHDWQQVQQLARELGDKGWENRATGELAHGRIPERQHGGGQLPWCSGASGRDAVR